MDRELNVVYCIVVFTDFWDLLLNDGGRWLYFQSLGFTLKGFVQFELDRLRGCVFSSFVCTVGCMFVSLISVCSE